MEIKWVPFVGNTGYILAAGALIPTYILNEKEVVFIDSGVHYDPGLISFIRAIGVSVYAVLQTHLHEDHCANNRIMISRFGTRIFAHPAEIEVVRSVENMHESWFVSQPETADKYLRSYRYPIEPVDMDRKEIVLRGTTFRVEPLYGHSQGHLGFVTPDNVLCTGDALLSPKMARFSKMPFFDNIAQAMDSMRKIAEMDYPYYALAHMEIIQSTVFSSASTLVSIIAGALILGEPLRWYHFICGAIILAGVVGLMLAPAKAENAGKSLEDDMNKGEN